MKILTTIFALVALAVPVTADEFHLGKPSEGRVIKGVLVAKTKKMYEIRVEGGTIWLPRNTVTKYVKTDATVADVKKAEDAARDKLAQANAERRKRQAVARAKRLAARKAWLARLDAQRAARRAVVTYRTHKASMYNPTLHRSYRSHYPSSCRTINHRVRVIR